MYTLGAASDAFAMSSYAGYTINTTVASGSTGSGAYVGSDKTTHVFFIGGDYNVTPAFNVSVGFYDIENDAVTAQGSGAAGVAIASTAAAANSMKEYSILADYHFSKRTDVYAGALSTNFSGFGSTVFTNNALYAVGIRHKF
jgi:predicted porin